MAEPRTATVNWNGTRFRAKEIQNNGDGSYVMEAIDNHPRVEAGHRLCAITTEITWDGN